MARIRIRVELVDQPGALGRMAAALGELDIDIVAVDVQEIDGTSVVDDLVVDTPDGMWPEDLRRRMTAAGAIDVSVADAVPQLVDAQVRCFEAAGAVVRAAARGLLDTEVERVLANVTGADRTWVVTLPSSVEAGLPSAAYRALDGEVPVTERTAELPEPLSVGDGPAWLLAVPGSPAPRRRVALIARSGDLRFTDSEIARSRSVLWLAESVEHNYVSDFSSQ
jgi:hypothetical protein